MITPSPQLTITNSLFYILPYFSLNLMNKNGILFHLLFCSLIFFLLPLYCGHLSILIHMELLISFAYALLLYILRR